MNRNQGFNIVIDTEKSYEVLIRQNGLKDTGAWLRTLFEKGKVLLISDRNVAGIYMDTVKESFEDAGFSVYSYIIKGGEKSKSLCVCEGIVEFLSLNEFSKTDVIASLGGGIVGDVSGFCASIYMRGIRYVQIPTSFLAAVDASCGGKNAVNLSTGKNLAGTLYQPSGVFCDPCCFKTLENRAFADGIAESIKYAILRDEKLLCFFEEHRLTKDDTDALSYVTARGIEIKNYYVSRDEHDEGIRKMLNLGHTIAHAIEKLSDYSISHGHSVAIGLSYMLTASSKMGGIKKEDVMRIKKLLLSYRLPIEADYDAEDIFRCARTDKKRSAERICIIVCDGIGKCHEQNISMCELKSIVRLGKEGESNARIKL